MELRGRGLADARVLSAIERVPRDAFVAPSFLDHAFDDTALPIECGQTISQPYVVALMSERLDVQPRHRVLEIGTGSGYQTAVLSHLCRMVYTIERFRTLSRDAVARLGALGVNNVVAKVGDGSQGWPEQAPFDRIMVTAAAETLPGALVDQLKPGGVMIVPVGRDLMVQNLVKVTRTAEGHAEEILAPVRFVPLVPSAESTADDRKTWRSDG